MTSAPRHFRKLSSTEAIYVATGLQVVSRSAVRGQISRAQVQSSVALLESHFVILRAAAHDGAFVERSSTSPAPLTWHASAATTTEQLYATLIDARLDLAQGLYQVHVIESAEGCEFFLLTSHAVTDATSLVEIHAFLIHLCDCTVRGMAPEIQEQPFPNPIDDAVEQALLALGHGEIPAPAPRDYAGAFLQLPTLPSTGEPGPRRHANHRLEIEAEDLRPVVEAAHRQGVTVHSLIAAAFARAVLDLAEAETRRLVLRFSVDMRRRLEPHVSTHLVFSAITGHATLIEDVEGPPFELAKRIHEDMRVSTDSGQVFLDYRNYPRNFAAPQDVPAALNMSDMGRIAFPDTLERLQVVGFDYTTAWGKAYPNASLTIYDGRLVVNTAYRRDLMESATLERLAERVVRQLKVLPHAEA